ncbi:MAG TPA: histidine kinase [Micromonosporaceae bacterium]|nr:histidine kinase [Micromonosporaceae bacterium]
MLRHGGVVPAGPSGGLDPLRAGLALSSTVPLLAWRRWPLGVFVITAVPGVLMTSLGYPVDLLIGPTVAVYLLAASRQRQTPWTARTTAIVAGLFAAYLAAAATAQDGFPALALLHTGMAFAIAWFAGDRTRLRREQMAELRERAARAERDAERERLLAVAEERARIARDLHDSAGHAINVIAVRAGAARLRQDPDRSLLALKDIEELARQTAGEIDQIVGTLRDGSTDHAPAGLASLTTLIAQHTAAGLRVTLDTKGEPTPLTASADQAAYRILQEALTNAAQHGSGSARIELAYMAAAVDLNVTNPVRIGATPREAGGHGLIGMHERATLLGGTLQTCRANGSFRLHARIPYGARRP